MSHFTVLVIGKDVEKQLAPFHEFECTGIDDKYVQDIDRTEEARKEYQSKEREGQTFAAFVEEWYGVHPIHTWDFLDLKGDQKYGYLMLDEHNEVLRFIDRTNENKKWDWWVVGGRWPDFLLLKNGKRADWARKGDIDFAAMRAAAEKQAGEDWDKINAIIAGRPVPSWEEVRTRHGESNIEAARTEYHANPVIHDLRGEWIEEPERYAVPRAEFVEREGRRRITTFAVVCDQQWHEKGTMGWWACVSDEKPPEEWQAAFWALVDAAPDDAVFTICDCHI
jgi:hypothetical protein